MKTSVKFTPSTATARAPARDRRIALVLAAAALGLYTRTLAPGLLDGDPGEFQFAAWRFGLAHPTGYPLYLILGGIWQRLLALAGIDPAMALNLFSAATAAAVVGLLYVLMVRWLPPTAAEPTQPDAAPRHQRRGELKGIIPAVGGWTRACAIFTALFFAVNPTFWGESVIAEVYSLHALFIVAIFLVAHWLWTAKRRRGEEATAEDRRPNTHHALRITFYSLLITHYFSLFLLIGLSLTHHRTTLFLLPGVILLLLWLDRQWWQRWQVVLSMLVGLLLPQLLYLYIPLRSGPQASPWLYQPLNGETLVLYEQSLRGFIDFVTGRVFAVSFLTIDGALARLPQMAHFWWIHFSATGLALLLLGLFFLWQQRNWPLLLLTAPFALILQIFNLFYGIGDIFVYYIPLYLVGSMWAGFGVWGIGDQIARSSHQDRAQAPRASRRSLRILLYAALILFTLLPLVRFYPEVDRSDNRSAELTWAAILGADPPQDAILISNDRNEIVPLYYLQAVEGRGQGLTGLFPLITPQTRFADVGAVIQTALAAGTRPVYLIKPMEGLSVRFHLEPAEAPLVHVTGVVDAAAVQQRLDGALGPMILIGYDWQIVEDVAEVVLYWRVDDPLAHNYTTTVQLFDAAGDRLAQSDNAPGGVYYPTSLWKAGEILRERHRLPLNSAEPHTLLVGMYRIDERSGELIHLAPPLEWPLQED